MFNRACSQLLTLFLLLALSEFGYTEEPSNEGNSAQINVSATIEESVCTVVNPYSDTNSVYLGKMRTADMHDAGNVGQWMPFNIELVNCPTQKKTVTMTITGPTDDNMAYYKNESDTTNTQNVAIELSDETGTKDLSNGKTYDMAIDQALHAATFAFKARMITPKGNAQVGPVSGHVELSFTYQ